MRKIIVATFTSMDGVLQAPGGPHEDTSGGFKYGGWMFHYTDDQTDNKLGQIMSEPFDLLLGRRTYEIFSAYWPYQPSDNPIATLFNRINKYVVASTPVDLSWEHSTLITGDTISELKKLKEQDGPDLLVHGSSVLIQSLLANKLIDELHIWTFPVTLGEGRKLFQDGTQAAQWKVTDVVIGANGGIVASYIPDGDIRLGSFETAGVSASKAELARREKFAKETY
ncbi:dihydrofolate reductase family protein [Chitinophaga filiformis]|uniref:dihydrofolate reductase family protein n=1 Tax=Chitinophaga filiformis TaxID=104663 RepID=UPI001F46A027|nr:dihydrofolate reductase family protein [Chitinophaga filiformis]MCF6405053.1 dihydrofolate reductase family protein [Chitinophaga filiformis]